MTGLKKVGIIYESMSLSASTDSDFKDTESEDNDHLRSGGTKNLLVSVGSSEFNCNVKGPHPGASHKARICHKSNLSLKCRWRLPSGFD